MMHDPLFDFDVQSAKADAGDPERSVHPATMIRAVMQRRKELWSVLYFMRADDPALRAACERHIARLRELLSEELPL